jgi:zinc protease
MEPILGENSFTCKIGTEPKSMVNEMAYFYTPYVQNDELALNLLAEVINNRITDVIREKMAAIYSGGVGMRLSKFPKEKFTMQSFLPCGPENAEKVKVAFWEIVNDCKKENNITKEELSKSYETALQKYKVGVQTNGFWLGSLSKYYQYNLPSENILNFESRLKAITKDDLTKLANQYLNSPNVLHALMMPVSKK